MTTDQQATGDEWWRRAPLYLVVLGAMAVSIGGQVATLQDRIGFGWAIVLALTNDVGAIIALDAAFSRFSDKTIRRWAWFAILLAAGTGAALNTYHTIHGDDEAALKELPTFYGWLIGIEPILLVLILTHLVGLLTAARRAAGGRIVGDEVADRQRDTGGGPPADTTGDHQRIASAPPARDRQAVSRPPALPAGDRQGPLVMTAGDTTGGALTVTTGPLPSPAGRASGTPTTATRSPSHPATDATAKRGRSTAAQEWMTDLLLRQVAKKLAAAAASGDRYGRPQIMKDHSLTDHQARTVLACIEERGLVREVAS